MKRKVFTHLRLCWSDLVHKVFLAMFQGGGAFLPISYRHLDLLKRFTD
jgi:hypothetical protein